MFGAENLWSGLKSYHSKVEAEVEGERFVPK